MKIETKYHGEIDIATEDIIQFEQGIPGFEDEHEFAVLPLDDDNVFYILQSVQTAPLGLVMTSPFHFLKEYDFTIEDSYVEQLQLEDAKDAAVYVILTVAENFADSTANLQAPVIINMKQHKGKQIILTNTPYETKQKLFPTTIK